MPWTPDDLTGYGDDALDELRVAVLTEQERRRNLASIPGQVAQLARTYVDGGGQLGDLDDAIAAGVNHDAAGEVDDVGGEPS